MAKQLLGKEVTAALNEKIKANVAEVLQSAVRLLVLHVRKSFFRRMFPRMSFLQPSIK